MKTSKTQTTQKTKKDDVFGRQKEKGDVFGRQNEKDDVFGTFCKKKTDDFVVDVIFSLTLFCICWCI
jgi:hypothetical protein